MGEVKRCGDFLAVDEYQIFAVGAEAVQVAPKFFKTRIRWFYPKVMLPIQYVFHDDNKQKYVLDFLGFALRQSIPRNQCHDRGKGYDVVTMNRKSGPRF